MSADGTWNVTMNTPMGAQKASLVLKTDGDKLTGEMKGPQGALALNDGKVAGDEIKFTQTREGGGGQPREFVAKRAK